MSSLSPRTKLTVFVDSDPVDPVPVSNNSTKMDGFTSITGCTSTTRPTTPYEGQWIYETDTQNVRRWSSTDNKWYLLGGSGKSNNAGLVATLQFNGNATLAGVAGGQNIQQVSLIDYNATLQNGHNYKVVEQTWFSMTGSRTTSGTFFIPELFTVYGVGANPAMNVNNAIQYCKQFYEDLQNSQRVPIRKTFGFQLPGSPGTTSTVYLRSVLQIDVSQFQPTTFIGKPADPNVTSIAWIYDLGIPGAN